jgi:hypothetical protein
MRPLSGTHLPQLIPSSWNESSRRLWPFVLIVFFAQDHYSYSFVLKELKLHTLPIRRHRLEVLFFIQVYLGLKFCPSVLEIVGL